MDDHLITADDVARLAGVSKRTLWRLVASGDFPQPVRFNRKLVRWKHSAVAAYLGSAERWFVVPAA